MIRMTRKIFALVLVFSLLTLPATLQVEAAATNNIQLTSQTTLRYAIQNVYSGKFLEVDDGNLVSGANVFQDAFNLDTNQAQIFRVMAAKSADMPGGNGGIQHYQLVPVKNTDLRLDVDNAADADGTNIKVFSVNHQYGAQSFAFIPNGDGSFRIQPHLSMDSGRVLTVVDRSTSNKANVVLSTWTGSSSQKWVFKEIHPSQDPKLINLNWSYFFRGDSAGSRRISRRIIESADGLVTHAGIDLPADQGTPIYSPCSGRVLQATYYDDMGYYVIIQSTQTISVGGEQKNLTMRLLHMNSAPIVSAGQMVTEDTLVGYVGSTGDSSDFHLHVDINTGNHTGGNAIRSDRANIINPEKLYLSKRFRYGLVDETAGYSTEYVFYPY